MLDETLGLDEEVDLPPARRLLDTNRKTIREFASRGIAVVGAWRRRNETAISDPWRSEDPQAVARHMENPGLLDFDLVGDQQIPALCKRAGCWPKGMPQTLDVKSLGLDEVTIEAEGKRRQQERERKVVEERSIDFAGARLDPAGPSFAAEFQELAEQNIAANEGWFERSRRPRLTEFGQLGGGDRQAGGGTGSRKGQRRKQPPEEQRQAMGLASEWLVFQYLRRRYGEAFDETCWISRNRTRFFGGGEGDDSAGYDFCVETRQTAWLYEVKSSLADSGEFEFTPNEMRVAANLPPRGRRQYRILYVPFVFSPDRWMVLELPNPMSEDSRNRFKQVGRGSVRFRFETLALQRPS